MKNEGLFPLERNNYFFGKLMTEREFNTEQAYFGNKRRLLNLAVMSSGIVCGMTVTRIDGATIAVESGLALDGLGRELAIPELIITLLSELDGFNDDRGHLGHVYLCAEYAEEQIEPVHVLGDDAGIKKYSRVRETVRLFLRYGEPEPFETESPDIQHSRAESLEDKLDRRARVVLFLAKIHLVRWHEAYEIDKIEQAPFNQYAILQTLPKPPDAPETEDKHKACQSDASPELKTPPALAFGTGEVKILEGAKPGSVYYSQDIPHGLGPIPAAVTLGLAKIDGAVFGDPAVFGGDTDFTYAACVSNYDGTFKIGVRVKTALQEQTVRFVWSAAADPARTGTDAAQIPRIVINPATARIKPLEMLRLTAERHGLPEDDIIWSVRESGGGEVTAQGEYVAPADPGVYTVNARCGSVSAACIIIVTRR